jgi:predicted solute-binding protein
VENIRSYEEKAQKGFQTKNLLENFLFLGLFQLKICSHFYMFKKIAKEIDMGFRNQIKLNLNVTDITIERLTYIIDSYETIQVQFLMECMIGDKVINDQGFLKQC